MWSRPTKGSLSDASVSAKTAISSIALAWCARLEERAPRERVPRACVRAKVLRAKRSSHIDKITDIRSDAEFILVRVVKAPSLPRHSDARRRCTQLAEKDAAYNRLAEDRFYHSYPCILITGKGQPDVATRMFLKRLKRELNIPILGFVDADPYGLKILSVYMSGSKNMSYDSASLTTPDIKWLGLRPSGPRQV